MHVIWFEIKLMTFPSRSIDQVANKFYASWRKTYCNKTNIINKYKYLFRQLQLNELMNYVSGTCQKIKDNWRNKIFFRANIRTQWCLCALHVKFEYLHVKLFGCATTIVYYYFINLIVFYFDITILIIILICMYICVVVVVVVLSLLLHYYYNEWQELLATGRCRAISLEITI